MSSTVHSHVRDLAVRVVASLQEAGHIAYWAGGCVRDMLLNIPPMDYDIVTNATPDRVLRLFPGGTEVGKCFAVVRVPLDDAWFDVATFREDHTYHDGRRPDGITFSTPEMDAQRRDFTINALFFDPIADALIDHVKGRRDLDDGILRCVGEPSERFQEDHLRLLRAVRFAARLGFAVELRTARAITSLAPLAANVAPERTSAELTRILTESRPTSRGLRLLADLELLPSFLPEIEALRGQEQPIEFHPEGDVFEHTCDMLDLLEAPSPLLAYAVLLHDIGKPPTATQCKDRLRFHGHAEKGADMAHRLLRRLRMPSDLIEAVTHCVRNHMRFMEVQNMRRATLRRLVGAPTFPDELELHRVDCASSHGKLDNYEFLLEFQKELATEPVLPAPWITGTDIIALGIPEGPAVGTWHKTAYDAQLESRFNSRDDLLAWLTEEISR